MLPKSLAAAACAIAALASQTPQASDPRTHVAVISVDGLGAGELAGRPTCLPASSTLRALAAQGAWSRGVTGVLPTITYPSHATLSTGTTPIAHGVIDNGVGGQWLSKRSDMKGEALWDAARKAGRSVALVTWPSTYGAAADWLVPEDLDNVKVATEEIRKGSTPGLFDALAAATGKPALLPFAHPDSGAPLDAMTAKFAAEVVRRHRPQLLLTHFLDYDHRMHARPHSPEACKALERTDAWIAQLVEAYRAAGILDRTTFFVVSDHGFMDVGKFVNLFGLLKEAGFEKAFPGQDLAMAFDLKVAGGSAALYPRGVKAAEAGRFAANLRAHVAKRYGAAVRWLTPAQARAFGGFPGAIATMCARPGYSFTLLPPSQSEVLVDIAGLGGMHGFCPDEPRMDALFIASGHGVRAAGAIPKMAMADVAPTIAAFLGARLPGASGRDRSARFRSSSGR